MDEPIIRRLHYPTHADLCEDAALTAIDDARKGKHYTATQAAKAHAASDAAHMKLTTMHRSSITLGDLVTEYRDQDAKAFIAYAERAVTDDSVLHGDEAEAAAERKALISSISGALEYYHRHLLPAERLATLRSDFQLFACAAQLSSWVALEAAIIRHDAGKALLEADNSIGFGEHGTAYNAFVAQLQAHAKAAGAEALVLQEAQRHRTALAQGVL